MDLIFHSFLTTYMTGNITSTNRNKMLQKYAHNQCTNKKAKDLVSGEEVGFINEPINVSTTA